MATKTLMSIGRNFFTVPVAGQETPSFQAITKDSTATWTSQPRLGRDNAMQFTGPGEETITIHGRLFPEIFGGLETMDHFRADLRAGKPLPVIAFVSHGSSSTVGNFVGMYVIRRVSKENAKFKDDGTPRLVEFTIELALYGTDVAGSTTSQSSSNESNGRTDGVVDQPTNTANFSSGAASGQDINTSFSPGAASGADSGNTQSGAGFSPGAASGESSGSSSDSNYVLWT